MGSACIRYIAFSPDGELIAYGGDDTSIIIVSRRGSGRCFRCDLMGEDEAVSCAS
jgi:WD40 repeat protein